MKLHQLIAVEKTVQKSSEDGFTAAYRDAQKPDLFSGIIKTYQPQDDEGYVFPGESKKVLKTGELLLSDAQAALEQLFDHVATKDAANQDTSADIVVNGVAVGFRVPVSTLLWLEKRLVSIREFVSKLPVLDPAEDWIYDEANSVYRSAPYKTARQVKKKRFETIAEATKEHKAQVAQVEEDAIEGTWTTVKLSGAMPASRKSLLLLRVDELTKAVKKAREEANSIEVAPVAIGNAMLNYLFSH
jgi:hypothetical protein